MNAPSTVARGLRLTPTLCRAMDIDLANTMRARAFHAANPPLVDAEDRALEVGLKGSTLRNAWRLKAGLPIRPTPKQVATWHALLNLRGALGAWRRNHPINQPRPAA